MLCSTASRSPHFGDGLPGDGPARPHLYGLMVAQTLPSATARPLGVKENGISAITLLVFGRSSPRPSCWRDSRPTCSHRRDEDVARVSRAWLSDTDRAEDLCGRGLDAVDDAILDVGGPIHCRTRSRCQMGLRVMPELPTVCYIEADRELVEVPVPGQPWRSFRWSSWLPRPSLARCDPVSPAPIFPLVSTRNSVGLIPTTALRSCTITQTRSNPCASKAGLPGISRDR